MKSREEIVATACNGKQWLDFNKGTIVLKADALAAMQEYADQETAALTERNRELEARIAELSEKINLISQR